MQVATSCTSVTTVVTVLGATNKSGHIRGMVSHEGEMLIWIFIHFLTRIAACIMTCSSEGAGGHIMGEPLYMLEGGASINLLWLLESGLLVMWQK